MFHEKFSYPCSHKEFVTIFQEMQETDITAREFIQESATKVNNRRAVWNRFLLYSVSIVLLKPLNVQDYKLRLRNKITHYLPHVRNFLVLAVSFPCLFAILRAEVINISLLILKLFCQYLIFYSITFQLSVPIFIIKIICSVIEYP